MRLVLLFYFQGTEGSREIYFFARLLNLLIHFENNNFEFLRYEVRSMERKLKGEKGFYKVEKATIEFLKKWIKTPLEVIHLHEFGEKLKELQEDKFEQKVLTTFNFHDWVNSKIKKVSLKEYIKKHKPVKSN